MIFKDEITLQMYKLIYNINTMVVDVYKNERVITKLLQSRHCK